MEEEYFVLQNLGYDGIYVKKHKDLVAAESDYKRILREEKDFEAKNLGWVVNKGTVLIKGVIVASNHPEEVFD